MVQRCGHLVQRRLKPKHWLGMRKRARMLHFLSGEAAVCTDEHTDYRCFIFSGVATRLGRNGDASPLRGQLSAASSHRGTQKGADEPDTPDGHFIFY